MTRLGLLAKTLVRVSMACLKASLLDADAVKIYHFRGKVIQLICYETEGSN